MGLDPAPRPRAIWQAGALILFWVGNRVHLGFMVSLAGLSRGCSPILISLSAAAFDLRPATAAAVLNFELHMQTTKTIVPKASRQAPMRDARFRALDCAAFDIMTSLRPLQGPPLRLAGRTTTAAQREAKRDHERAGGVAAAPLEADENVEPEATLSIVVPATWGSGGDWTGAGSWEHGATAALQQSRFP